MPKLEDINFLDKRVIREEMLNLPNERRQLKKSITIRIPIPQKPSDVKTKEIVNHQEKTERATIVEMNL